MFGLGKKKHGRPVAYGEIAYTPFRERLEGADQHNFIQPMPWVTDNYLTYWYGNRIPPTTVFTHSAHTNRQYVNARQQETIMPQLRGSGFGAQMGQLDTASLIARWKQRMQSIGNQYGN